MVGARPSAGFGLIASLTANSGVPIVWPSGVQPGDLAILFKKGTAPASPWGVVSALGARTPGVYAVILSPSDIITPLTPNANYNCLVYRGVQSVTQVATYGTQGPPGSGTQLGFTKNAASAGRVAVAGNALAYSIPTVATFTVRATQADATNHWNVLDNFDLDGATIAAGVTVTWNASDPSGSGWLMLELRT